jgi:hypothetical protein
MTDFNRADFNAVCPDRPGVSVGEDLADKLLAATFQIMLLVEVGGRLRDWARDRLASPHRPGEDGHCDGCCRRCADLYAAGNTTISAWEQAAAQHAPTVDRFLDLAFRLRMAATGAGPGSLAELLREAAATIAPEAHGPTP